MQRIPVGSFDLRAVGYNPASQTLEIEFHSGGIYQYYGVPWAIYHALMAAGSHGSYFHARVKDHHAWQCVGVTYQCDRLPRSARYVAFLLRA